VKAKGEKGSLEKEVLAIFSRLPLGKREKRRKGKGKGDG